MKIMGIDPGMSGGLALLDGLALTVMKMPDNPVDLARQVQEWWPRIACLERVSAMPHDGRSSLAKFMENYGICRGVLAAFAIETMLVRPQQWQGRMGLASTPRVRGAPKLTPKEKARRKRDHKAMIAARAKSRWPGVRITLATADAAWIAAWGLQEFT